MKVWELSSIVRDQQLLIRTASLFHEWSWVTHAYTLLHEVVNQQDRKVLDSDLPDAYVQNVLATASGVCFLGTDETLRSCKADSSHHPLSYLQVFQRFGGPALEEALEFGSFFVGQSNEK